MDKGKKSFATRLARALKNIPYPDFVGLGYRSQIMHQELNKSLDERIAEQRAHIELEKPQEPVPYVSPLYGETLRKRRDALKAERSIGLHTRELRQKAEYVMPSKTPLMNERQKRHINFDPSTTHRLEDIPDSMLEELFHSEQIPISDYVKEWQRREYVKFKKTESRMHYVIASDSEAAKTVAGLIIAGRIPDVYQTVQAACRQHRDVYPSYSDKKYKVFQVLASVVNRTEIIDMKTVEVMS